MVAELDHDKSNALERTFKSFLFYVRHKKLQDFLPEPLQWLPLDRLNFRRGKGKLNLYNFLSPPYRISPPLTPESTETDGMVSLDVLSNAMGLCCAHFVCGSSTMNPTRQKTWSYMHSMILLLVFAISVMSTNIDPGVLLFA